MIAYIIIFSAGTTFGLFIGALMAIAHDSDRNIEQ